MSVGDAAKGIPTSSTGPSYLKTSTNKPLSPSTRLFLKIRSELKKDDTNTETVLTNLVQLQELLNNPENIPIISRDIDILVKAVLRLTSKKTPEKAEKIWQPVFGKIQDMLSTYHTNKNIDTKHYVEHLLNIAETSTDKESAVAAIKAFLDKTPPLLRQQLEKLLQIDDTPLLIHTAKELLRMHEHPKKYEDSCIQALFNLDKLNTPKDIFSLQLFFIYAIGNQDLAKKLTKEISTGSLPSNQHLALQALLAIASKGVDMLKAEENVSDAKSHLVDCAVVYDTLFSFQQLARSLPNGDTLREGLFLSFPFSTILTASQTGSTLLNKSPSLKNAVELIHALKISPHEIKRFLEDLKHLSQDKTLDTIDQKALGSVHQQMKGVQDLGWESHRLTSGELFHILVSGNSKLQELKKESDLSAHHVKKNSTNNLARSLIIDPTLGTITILSKDRPEGHPQQEERPLILNTHGGVKKITTAITVTQNGAAQVDIQSVNLDTKKIEKQATEIQEKIGNKEGVVGFKSHTSYIKTKDGKTINKESYIQEKYDMDLFDYVAQQDPLPDEECLSIFSLLAKGIDAIHGEHIAHRDIKLENILFRKSASGEVEVAISDFDFAFGPEFKQTSGGLLYSTLAYSAPESLAAIPESYRKTVTMTSIASREGRIALNNSTELCTLEDEQKKDMYALGATLASCLTGLQSFGESALTQGEAFSKVLQEMQKDNPTTKEVNAFNDILSRKETGLSLRDKLKLVTKFLLVTNPELRLSAQEFKEVMDVIQSQRNTIDQN